MYQDLTTDELKLKQLYLQHLLTTMDYDNPKRGGVARQFASINLELGKRKIENRKNDVNINTYIIDILKGNVSKAKFDEIYNEALKRVDRKYIKEHISIFDDEQQDILFGNKIQNLNDTIKAMGAKIEQLINKINMANQTLKLEGEIPINLYDMITKTKAILNAKNQ